MVKAPRHSRPRTSPAGRPERPAAAPDPLDRFDGFRISRPIPGGADRKYLATSVGPGPVATVVIKERERPPLTPDPDDPFMREMRALSEFGRGPTPGLAPRLVSCGTLRCGRPYFVMEHAGTDTLADRLGRGAVEWRELCRWVAELARGVAVLHGLGWAHGDLWPKNVIVTDDGRVRLIDFGSVYRIEGGRRPQGAPGFWDPVDNREGSDVYSLGAILYYGLTGKTIPARGNRPADECPLPKDWEKGFDYPPQLISAVRNCVAAQDRLDAAEAADWIDEISRRNYTTYGQKADLPRPEAPLDRAISPHPPGSSLRKALLAAVALAALACFGAGIEFGRASKPDQAGIVSWDGSNALGGDPGPAEPQPPGPTLVTLATAPPPRLKAIAIEVPDRVVEAPPPERIAAVEPVRAIPPVPTPISPPEKVILTLASLKHELREAKLKVRGLLVTVPDAVLKSVEGVDVLDIPEANFTPSRPPVTAAVRGYQCVMSLGTHTLLRWKFDTHAVFLSKRAGSGLRFDGVVPRYVLFVGCDGLPRLSQLHPDGRSVAEHEPGVYIVSLK